MSGTAGIAVVSVRGVGMPKTDGRISELAAAGVECSNKLLITAAGGD